MWQDRIVGTGAEDPEQLLANPRNWRLHPKQQQDALAGVLDRVGWVQQVIVNQTTGHLVDGHLRVSLAMAREEPSIPVVYVELSPDEEALILATLDPLSAMAGEDRDVLGDLLASLSESDQALAALTDDKPMQREVTEDDVPDLPAEPKTKPGDLWLLGEHRVLCGDSTKAEDVDRVFMEQQAACMWTDPPYGVAYVGKTKRALTIQNDDAKGLPSLLDAAFAAAGKSLEPGAPVYLARPPGAQGVEFLLAFQRAGWSLHEELQWVKDTMVLGHSDYHLRHETIVYGWTPGGGRSGRGKHAGSRWYGQHNATSVFEVPKPSRSDQHPTSKPVALVSAMLMNSLPEGGLVFDPFLGSGSTLIAAEQTDRRCYGLELDPAYCDVIVERWENLTGQKAVLDA